MSRLEDPLLEVRAEVPRRAIGQTIDPIVHIRRTRKGRLAEEVLEVEGHAGETYRVHRLT